MKKIILFCLLFVCISSDIFGQIDSGLVFYLPCNGTLKDSTIYDRKPTANYQMVAPSMDRWGKLNSALAQPVNTNAGIQFRDSMMRSNIYTISMWINIDSIRYNGRGYLFNIGYDVGGISYGIGLEVSGLTGFEFKSKTTAGSPNSGVVLISKDVTFKSGRWIHLFGTRDTNSMIFYINDTLAGSKTIAANAKNLQWNPQDSFAVIFACGGQFITGRFDEVRVYNRVLSAIDRHALYNFEKPASYLALDKDTIDIGSAATNQTINISSNTTWTATSSQPWVSINPTTGSNNGSITLSISANTSATLRNATITLAGNGAGTKSVYVRQQPMPADILVLNKDTINTSNSAKAEIVSITSNRSWTAASDKSWAIVTPTSGTGNGSLTMNVAANSGGVRSANIIVTAGSVVKTLILNQAKGTTFIDSLSLDKDSLFINKTAAIYSVGLTSNTGWTAIADQSWVTIVPGSGTGNGSLQVSIAANTNAERVAEMTVVAGAVSRKVYIKQESGSVGLAEVNSNQHLVTYPNPVTDGVFNISDLLSSGTNHLVVYDITGKMMMNIDDVKAGTPIHVSDLKPGVYFLTIENERVMRNGKLIIK